MCNPFIGNFLFLFSFIVWRVHTGIDSTLPKRGAATRNSTTAAATAAGERGEISSLRFISFAAAALSPLHSPIVFHFRVRSTARPVRLLTAIAVIYVHCTQFLWKFGLSVRRHSVRSSRGRGHQQLSEKYFSCFEIGRIMSQNANEERNKSTNLIKTKCMRRSRANGSGKKRSASTESRIVF